MAADTLEQERTSGEIQPLSTMIISGSHDIVLPGQIKIYIAMQAAHRRVSRRTVPIQLLESIVPDCYIYDRSDPTPALQGPRLSSVRPLGDMGLLENRCYEPAEPSFSLLFSGQFVRVPGVR